MRPRKTNDQFIQEVYKLVGNEYTFLEKYKTNRIKMLIIHNVCKNKYYVSADKFLNAKRRCPFCNNNAKRQRLANTQNEIINKLHEIVGTEYELKSEYKNNKTKVKLLHNKCGNIYEVSTNDFINLGHRCPYCNNFQRYIINKNNFIKLLRNEYELKSEYKNSRTKVKLLHMKCNNEFLIKPNDYQQGHRCPYCVTNNPNGKLENEFCDFIKELCKNMKGNEMGRKAVSIDQFKQEIKKLGNNEYTIIDGENTYKNNKSKVKLKHSVCNYIWETNRDNFVNRGNRCKMCAKQAQWNKKRLQDFINIKYNNKYLIIDDTLTDDTTIIPVKENIRIKNMKCNHEYNILVSSLLTKDHNCKVCGKNRRQTIETVKKELTNTEYEVIDNNYYGTHKKILVKHNVCGNIYLVSRTNFLGSPNRKGRKCPFCSKTNKISIEEKEFNNFTNSLGIECLEHDRNILNGKELDIFIPSKKIAFEFDGLYWHTEGKGKDKNYHLNKTLLCEEQGIQLIHIFEDEWVNKKNIVKTKIKHIIGCNNNPKVYARECYIEEISSNDKNQFLEENHIQGKDNSKIKLGLWYPMANGDRLVGVMTFCKPRKALGQTTFKTEFDYELSRFATDIEFRVIGAFGKLWKYFEKNYEFNKIITYADRRWSKGNVYEKNGFKLDHISKPNYWYLSYSCNKREYRYTYRKTKLKELFPDIYEDSKTEKEIMKEAGYDRIWDCGNLVYVKSRNI